MRKFVPVFAVLLALVFGATAFLIFKNNKEEKPAEVKTSGFYDQKTGITLNYSEKLNRVSLSEEEKNSQFFLRLEDGPREPAEILIRVSYEERLRSVAALAKSELIPLLLANAEKSLPQKFPNYKLESRREFELANHKAGEVIFTYTGSAKQQVKRRFLVIDKDGSTVVYLALETAAENYHRVNLGYFEPLIQSINF